MVDLQLREWPEVSKVCKQMSSSTSADVVLAVVLCVGVDTHSLGMGKGWGSLYCLKWCYTGPGLWV